MRDARFADDQRRHFEQADAAHFRWTTASPGFAESEEALLAPFAAMAASPCLEIGCGEGGNLLRLARRTRCVGLDRFPAKVAFAAAAVPAARFAVADAAFLPFRPASFRTVFIRDVLHHVDAPEGVLAEAVRVLVPGGRLHVLEPNRLNPLIRLQTVLVPAERGARRSGAGELRGLLQRFPVTRIETSMLEPFPLRRAVLHYRLGLPWLGRLAFVRGALGAVEAAFGRMLAPARWSYIALTAERTA